MHEHTRVLADTVRRLLLEAIDRKLSDHASFPSFSNTAKKVRADVRKHGNEGENEGVRYGLARVIADCCYVHVKALTPFACFRAYLLVLNPGRSFLP